jgi:hypothetical protein
LGNRGYSLLLRTFTRDLGLISPDTIAQRQETAANIPRPARDAEGFKMATIK